MWITLRDQLWTKISGGALGKRLTHKNVLKFLNIISTMRTSQSIETVDCI